MLRNLTIEYPMISRKTIDFNFRASGTESEVSEGVSSVGCKVVSDVWSPSNKNTSSIEL